MSDYFDRIERQLVRRVAAAPPGSARLSAGLRYLPPAAAVLVVIVVVAVFAGLRGNGSPDSPASGRGAELVFAAVGAGPYAPSGRAIEASVDILRRRLAAVLPGVRVARAGDLVVVRGARSSTRATILALAAPGELRFYDWEAAVLTPDGKTVASQLRTQGAAATEISQGAGASPPGGPQAGGLPLYQAVSLAAKLPAKAAAGSSRRGPQYYLFDRSASPACASAGQGRGGPPGGGGHCLLAGPAGRLGDLRLSLPAGVRPAHGQVLRVPQGIAVLQAANPTPGKTALVDSPKARFYVLEDRPSLTGADITDPRQSTDQSGQPDVAFGFSAHGAARFRNTAAAIARRGAALDTAGQTLNQHFAIALDNQLLTVPSIDFRAYPNGIAANGGADISGVLNSHAARILSILLRYGPLPVELVAR